MMDGSPGTRVAAVAILVAAVIVGLVVIGPGATGEATTLSGFLAGTSATMEVAGGYTVFDRETRTVSGIEVVRLEARNGSQEIHLRAFRDGGAAFAENYLREKRREISSLYTTTPAPYAAVPTREVNCSERFKPNVTARSIDGQNYTYYTMYADEGFQYGVCDTSDITYRARMLTAYCADSRTLYQVEYFEPYPGGEGRDPLRSFRCGGGG